MRALPFLTLLLFLGIPLIEIYLLIQVGGWIGALPTVFLVVFTAVLGVLLLRQQGFAALQRVQAAMAQGQIPAMELLEAMLLTLGGILLLVPGFFTDALGFLCLIPPLRRWLVRGLLDRYFLGRPPGPPGAGPRAPGSGSGPVTLEGEFKREE
ncbi:MAG: FxsA family protein [Pseudomonadota bacterium]|jgi:UPF0716 protein FxsA